jgi:hypothetical protein
MDYLLMKNFNLKKTFNLSYLRKIKLIQINIIDMWLKLWINSISASSVLIMSKIIVIIPHEYLDYRVIRLISSFIKPTMFYIFLIMLIC